MAKKSKWFCIAVEGATATDNRVITAQMLTEMGTGYNRATYGARVNMEHIKGYSATGDFKCYGDVLATETRDVEIEIDGKKQKRLGLYAQIEPTDELVTITDAKQKIYTSMEIQPNFAKTGKFGLIGVAATDTPASLGTDILKFSVSPDAFFSAAYETTIEFETDAGAGMADVVKAFAAIGDKIIGAFSAKSEPPPKPANENDGTPPDLAAIAAAFSTGIKEMGDTVAAGLKAANDQNIKLSAELAALKTDLENTPKKFSQRPPATGGDGRVRADC